MSRRWEDGRTRPVKRGIPGWQWAVILGGSTAILAPAIAAIVTLATARTGSQEPPPPSPEESLPTRVQFRDWVIGKTAEEVLEHLGRPNWTDEFSSGKIRCLTYRDCVFDPIAGRTVLTMIYFSEQSGRCTRVSYP